MLTHVSSHLSVSMGKRDQVKYIRYQQEQSSYPKKIWKKRTKYFLKDGLGESGEYHDENEKEYKATYGGIYTDKR